MDVDGPHPANFSHLFTSNATPQPREIASIQYEIAELTRSIDQVQLRLDRLQQQFRKLEGQRQGYRALLSPLRRIPPETLGEIIGCVQDLAKEDSAKPVQNHLMSLCLVSRTWRDAALATPRLWSNLEMCGIPTSLWLDTAFRWFGRCEGVSKTLSIYGSPHEYQSCATPGGGRCEFANPALAKLLTEGPLIDRLNLSCTSFQCFRNLIESMSSLKTHEPRPWDSIKSLEVGFHKAWSEPGAQESHADSIFNHIPFTVSSLYLYLEDMEEIVGLNDEPHLHIPKIVLTSLTTFTFSCDWPDGTLMVQILQSCTNVENLTLDFRGSFVGLDDNPFPQEAGSLLPRVRILHLDRMIPGVVDFIQALRTPSLAELHFSFLTDTTCPAAFTDLAYVSDNFASSVLSFVRASSCQGSLRKFRLDSANIPNLELITILANLPFLTHLTLDNTFFDPTPFQGGSEYIYSGTPLLPCLEVLELLRLPPDFPRDAMSHFVVARRPQNLNLPGVLKRFVMTFRKYQPPNLSLLVDKFKNNFPIETTCFAFV